MVKAWLIGHITVKDAAKWDEYRCKVPATMAPFGAELTFSDIDLGDGFLVDTSGWAVAEARSAMRDG